MTTLPITMAALDLHDLALLLNYERASTEPRFRNAKLTDIAADDCLSDAPFATFPDFKALGWGSLKQAKTALLFTREGDSTKHPQDAPDLPSNLLGENITPPLAQLSEYDLETLYWQARGHDGCYKSIAMLQFFFDKYPRTQPLRIRTTTGHEFVTSINKGVIMEWELLDPKQITIAAVRVGTSSDTMSYVTGLSNPMLHAGFGFATQDGENVSAVLDLASMQYGEPGRARKSQGTFALESLDHFYDRLETLATDIDASKTKTSLRIGTSADDEWLAAVADRVKTRWEARDTEHWCGHCGAPSLQGIKLKKCGKCPVYYCNAAHQKSAWPFHKNFCAGKTTK
ncbi:hypothetical protein PVAG01_09538 [Phlyctema vagabunda]|uniref:MYND-type domain-containing protein n=1 Tax=Phlyctema vagabunda TaxID=108571 RepID=A0ABR4P8A9_9HELO